MKRDFFGTIPKDSCCPEANEDKFAFSDDGKRFALSDGASESFDSKRWAELLVRKFVDDPAFQPDWIEAALTEYSNAYDFPSMSWSKQAAYELGSFATLVGVEYFEEHNAVEVLAIGDSIALLLDGERLVCGWPFQQVERFKERPTLLATIAGHNEFIGFNGFWTEHGTTFSLGKLSSPNLLCLTDAIGEWALRQALDGGQGISELLSIRSDEQLSELVLRERAGKRMRIDDSTLIVLSFDRE